MYSAMVLSSDRVLRLPHAGQVHLNGFTHEVGGFIPWWGQWRSILGGRNGRAVAGGSLLEQDGRISFYFSPACFRILISRVFRSQVHRRMARNRDAPFFGRMFILAMAALEIHP